MMRRSAICRVIAPRASGLAVWCPLVFVAASAGAAPIGLWPADPNLPVKLDEAPPASPPAAVRLVGPRNGAVSGVVVAKAAAPITALSATITELARAGGGTIPKSAVQIRYASIKGDLSGLSVLAPWKQSLPGKPEWEACDRGFFDALAEAPAPGATVLPVWVTVRIPADAAPGEYTATLAVKGTGVSGQVPVRLKVCAFTLPAPKDYSFWLSFNPSPDTVAWRYAVPLYSDAHFKLMERSFQLLGQLGNHVLYVPAIEKGLFGNAHCAVQWRKTGEKLTPDFRSFDRLYEQYVKHCGPPRLLVVELWENYLGGAEKAKEPMKVGLTLTDGGGKLESLEIDAYPANPEVWKSLLDGFYGKAAKMGVKPESICLGVANDGLPTKAQVDFFREMAPKAGWVRFTHGYGGYQFHGVNLVHGELPDWGVDQTKPVRGGWDGTSATNTVRDLHGDNSPPFILRCCPDIAVGGSRGGPSRGFSRCGLDFWPVVWPTDKPAPENRKWRPQPRPFIGWRPLYPQSGVDRLYRSLTASVTVPGPDGALATARFEMLREGIQETEARVTLEKALRAKRLDGDLKARAEAALLDRAKAIGACRERGNDVKWQALASWQALSEKLYDVAGEAQRAAGGGKP
jgi:hypothetical protein